MNKTVFTKDEVNKKMTVERTFNAPLPLVWKAWTDPEILDQWWAPKPFKTETQSMDFSEGGRWLYVMAGPEGERHWCKVDYHRIDPENFFQGLDGFCDENGVPSQELPSMMWHVGFDRAGSTTNVVVNIDFPTAEAMNAIIEMGFKEGFSMAHENLDALLAEVSV